MELFIRVHYLHHNDTVYQGTVVQSNISLPKSLAEDLLSPTVLTKSIGGNIFYLKIVRNFCTAKVAHIFALQKLHTFFLTKMVAFLRLIHLKF